MIFLLDTGRFFLEAKKIITWSQSIIQRAWQERKTFCWSKESFLLSVSLLGNFLFLWAHTTVAEARIFATLFFIHSPTFINLVVAFILFITNYQDNSLMRFYFNSQPCLETFPLYPSQASWNKSLQNKRLIHSLSLQKFFFHAESFSIVLIFHRKKSCPSEAHTTK